MNNIELQSVGLKCDNTLCDWTNNEVSFEDYGNWINIPCPKCGQNLLTFEDYKRAEKIKEMADYLNSLSEEELEEMNNEIDWEELKKDPFFSDAEGIDDVKGDDKGCHVIQFSTHNEIKLKSIKKCNDGDETTGSIE